MKNMKRTSRQSWQAGVLLCSVLTLLVPSNQSRAEEGAGSFGGIEPKTWVLGVRAGFAPLTQTMTDNFQTSTGVGPLVNVEALYSINNWLLVGMMVEWERHGVDQERRFSEVELGHQDTVSVLPTIEIRPVKLGAFVPYANMSFGVNVNSFGESTGTRISPSNNFAWRIGGGADYMVTQRVALNAEWAYKRNDGHATIDGERINDWNASSFGFLFGVKAFF